MKDIAPFLGVSSPDRRAATKALGLPPDGELIEACKQLYALDEREYHYVAADALRARAAELPSSTLEDLEWFIRTKSWWDTVDTIAHAVGDQVLAFPQHAERIRTWVHDPDFWVARVAIIHQNAFRADTDEDLLFELCLARAADREFFLRKAIGWALRSYAWTNPEPVRSFVEAHRGELSSLSIREALKNMTG